VMTTRALATAAALALCSAPAFAQQYSSASKINIHAFGIVEVDSIAATKSFDAVLGTSQLTAAGAGAEIGGIWKGLFVRVAATQAQKSGHRVFIDNGTVFPLPIGIKVTLKPVEAGVGWRFATHSRFEPYVGAAFVSLGYQEESDNSDVGDNVNDRYTGAAVFGGVNVIVYKWIVVGGEGQYRRIQPPVASRGASVEFNERDLGGATGRVTIGVRF